MSATFGDPILSLMQAQNARIAWRVGNSPTGTFTDFVRMRRLGTDQDHPETRQNYQNGHAYHYGSPDGMIEFAVTITRDLASDLKLKNTRDANNVLPTIYWQIIYKDDAGKDVTVTGQGYLPRLRTDRGFNAQGEEVAYELFLRVIGLPTIIVDA
ncbi:MAG: hypothetical protein K8823_1550 [Cenarchaeum symbiont of Oopsacas minuta]|nr:hypothetical protein [Cenarchaeum symbiont of Oopsacas minuta]